MALLGQAGTSVALKFMVCLGVLAIPTVAMGATFPVLAAALIGRATAEDLIPQAES